MSPVIAVLICSFNRKAVTLRCLERLRKQKVPHRVYLVDDGSTDGTPQAVSSLHPEVHLLGGTGGLYWCGAMRLAFGEALRAGYSDYIWLNDDVELHDDAFERLLHWRRVLTVAPGRAPLVIGSLASPGTTITSYGGLRRRRPHLSASFMRVAAPQRASEPCDTINGNLVLISDEIARAVGNVSSSLIHGLGDLDYGLRTAEAGFGVFVAPGFYGECARNSPAGTWSDPDVAWYRRLRLAFGVKNFPISAWTWFIRRHGGPLWPLLWLAPYVRAILGPRSD